MSAKPKAKPKNFQARRPLETNPGLKLAPKSKAGFASKSKGKEQAEEAQTVVEKKDKKQKDEHAAAPAGQGLYK